MSIKLRPTALGSGLTCPYCRDDVHSEEHRERCSGCQTDYHAECLSELGRCGTLGCSGIQDTSGGACLRCREQIDQHDLVLRCLGCAQLYHRDCFIPGAACAAPACGGRVEFVKRAADPRPLPLFRPCANDDCQLPRAGLGWWALGPSAARKCRDHAAQDRWEDASLIALLPVFFAFEIGVNAISIALLVLGCALAIPFVVDARRIQRARARRG